MSKGLETVTGAVVAYCSGCGDLLTDADQWPVTFSAPVEAAEKLPCLYGWRVEGRTLTCAGCLARPYCLSRGHDWKDEWRESSWYENGRPVRANLARGCHRCSATDVRVFPIGTEAA